MYIYIYTNVYIYIDIYVYNYICIGHLLYLLYIILIRHAWQAADATVDRSDGDTAMRANLQSRLENICRVVCSEPPALKHSTLNLEPYNEHSDGNPEYPKP